MLYNLLLPSENIVKEPRDHACTINVDGQVVSHVACGPPW